jgi:carbamoyl-phosphate synthase small subunit
MILKYQAKSNAILLLQDGTIFHGKAVGKTGTATGEICFNTSMTGYQEIFTDPSYYGQIIVMTAAHIGNYGTHKEETESETVKISGLVCKNFSSFYSRPQAEYSLQNYLSKHNVVGISNIDTRSLVRHIRSKGAMNVIISSEINDIEILRKKLAATPSMEGLELSSKVSSQKNYFVGQPNSKYKVAALDVGVKSSIVKCLAERNCYVKVFPMNALLKDIEEFKPDGILISNGPGDPAPMKDTIKNIQQLIAKNYPLMGICLGHQLIALATGLKTYKMKNGHRGSNHPVLNITTGKCEVTSQNHGFAVVNDENKKIKNLEITHINLNDHTVEGLRLTDKPVFSIQYHPEASAGPHDARYLFDEFIQLMNKFSLNLQSNQKAKVEQSA